MKSRYTLLAIILSLPTLAWGESKLQVDFITPSIARVQWSPTGAIMSNETGVCIYTPQEVEVKREESAGQITLSTADLIVQIDKAKQRVSFVDPQNGHTILSEALVNAHESHLEIQERIIYDESSAHVEETANGKVTVRDIVRRDTIGTHTCISVNFRANEGQALYGLGSQMEDYLNLWGKTLYLTQHNLKVQIPMLCSTNGYGLLFDAGCAMKFVSDAKPVDMQGHNLSIELEAANELDYYFIKGNPLEEVVAGYRYLTGAVSLLPRYVFGYTQSKERYVSSSDLISTLREYRERHIPIDMIVQDWNYWPQGWGYMKMDPKFYPDPKALADSIHDMNAKLMVSIWPNPQWCPEADDFKEHGYMLEHDVYDVFNPEARRYYWQYADNEFFSRGFDAWWCDSSEPLDGDWNQTPEPVNDRPYSWEDHERRWHLNQDVLSEAMGAKRSSLYSLYHSMGIYENQRLTSKDKRVVNLTRSSYAGQQRYGTVVWNGDTHASWDSFRQQIPSGLNYMATGNPYWTVDVGSFFTRGDGRRWFYVGEFPEGVKDDAYKEYYLRMFQWGTFLPMLRSHGSDTPREVWRFITDAEEKSQCPLEDGKYTGPLLQLINFRYAHIPYIYSMAARQSLSSYTMARLLAFDFAQDTTVFDIKDQYMFGDFLVCPVTHPLSETDVRRVYLPAGAKWVDYQTNQQYNGGQWMDYKLSNVSQFPLFVRCGSIITTTEVTEYSAAQYGLPITVEVYPGANAAFNLYEDEGDNYNYEQGARSLIPFTWDDNLHLLTIGQRKGKFVGMQEERTFKLHLIDKGKNIKKEITYTGHPVSVRL